jgi:hypothetical protein
MFSFLFYLFIYSIFKKKILFFDAATLLITRENSQICDHSQEELATSGYRSERKVERFKNPAI